VADINPSLHFLKLGGSLITDKSRPYTARLDAIQRLASEISAAKEHDPKLQLILGHGSGSFGHVAAQKHGTRQGVHTPQQWSGFLEVWHEAATLNRLVVDAFYQVGLPIIVFSPLAMVTAQDGQVFSWDLSNMCSALVARLLPVVHGDVAFDTMRGGTILSTEDLFVHLAGELHPRSILLAGSEAGVWADFPTRQRLIPEITPDNATEFDAALGGSTAADVTGGMATKVQQCLQMIAQNPQLEMFIFSGEEPEAVQRALSGEKLGTWLHGI